MKKFTITFLAVNLCMAMLKSQIPNGGFEDWSIESSIEIPVAPWLTNNLLQKPVGITYNPVTKSADHYPASVGNYSIRLENNISLTTMAGAPLPYWPAAYGYTITAFELGKIAPAFPVSGHPNSFRGYYKFFPVNNDTMSIALALFNNGTPVAYALLTNSDRVSEWTSFNIPITPYLTADSAQIGFAAFYTEVGSVPSGPYGNSVLYVDNLSFDNLITDVPEAKEKPSIQIYPNPASRNLSLNNMHSGTPILLNIYNISGSLIRSELLSQNQQNINVEDLKAGIYILEIKSNSITEKKRLIINRK